MRIAWARGGYIGRPFQRKQKPPAAGLKARPSVQAPEHERGFPHRAREDEKVTWQPDFDDRKRAFGPKKRVSEPEGPVWRRERLIKLLGMLGTDQAGERASAALMVDQYRRRFNKEWDDLIISDPLDDDDDWEE